MIDWDKRFLALAGHVAMWSKDPSTKVGAVITDEEKRIVGLGYNGFPRGVPDRTDWLENKEDKYYRIVHAELNAILNSSTTGHTIYVYPYCPCTECTKAIIQRGIKRVVVSEGGMRSMSPKWRKEWDRSLGMLNQARIEVSCV